MNNEKPKKKHEQDAEEARSKADANAQEPVIEDVFDMEDDVEQALQNQIDETADLKAKLEAAEAQVEKEKKEYLFLMADFDNYRKRTLREKSELLKNAGEKVLAGLLPIVDDFERALEAAAKSDDAEAIRQGVELIYNKLIKYLESNGVKAMDSTGAEFDPELHEAIATIPAPSEDLKGRVVDTTQKGYMLNDKVLRHAKVAVGE